MVQQILERHPKSTQAQVVRRVRELLAEQRRFPGETTLKDYVGASLKRRQRRSIENK